MGLCHVVVLPQQLLLSCVLNFAVPTFPCAGSPGKYALFLSVNYFSLSDVLVTLSRAGYGRARYGGDDGDGDEAIHDK